MRGVAAGQAITEYAILIGVVVAALLGMQVYAKRGLQAGIKATADRLSPFLSEPGGDPGGRRAQREGMRYEAGERQNRAIAAPGDVLVRESKTVTISSRTVEDKATTPGGGRTRKIEPATPETTSTSGALSYRGLGVASYSEVRVDEDQ